MSESSSPVYDKNSIQTRMLNRGKGPAVHSLRAQIDRRSYTSYMKHCIEKQEHDFVCLNDGDIEVDFDMLSARLAASFEKILPYKSEFEL